MRLVSIKLFHAIPLLILLFSGIQLAHAAAGDSLFYAFPTEGIARAVAVTADGKIVIAGDYYDGVTDSDMFVARMNPDGTNDGTFYSGYGYRRTDFGNGFDFAWDIVIQPDGKIVLGGHADSVSNNDDFALVRYNTDGLVDEDFSGGRVTTDFAGSKDDAFAIALQPDGKILLGGYAYSGGYDFALARYNPDGSLDNSFGVNGKVTTDINGSDRAFAVAVQSDGKILLGGKEYTNNHSALVRYNSDGTIDNTFGNNGIVTTDFGGSSVIRSLVVQPDGKILAGGESSISGNKYYAIARYNSNGNLDPNFSTNGKFTLNPVPGAFDFAGQHLYLQPDGNILMVGIRQSSSRTDVILMRLHAYGFVDTAFGDNGYSIFTYDGYDPTFNTTAAAIAMTASGKITVAGHVESFGSSLAAIAVLDNDSHLGILAPGNFNFNDVTDVPQSTVVTSDSITIDGLESMGQTNTMPVRISGGEYTVNAGSYTTDMGYATVGDQISVRHVSAADAETSTDTLLTVGGMHAPNNLSLVLGGTTSDTFTSTTAEEITDTDNDGVDDNTDNCTLIANAAQRDTDSDGYGNFCDPDFDNNLVVNASDLANFKTKFFTDDADADFNGNNVVNAADLAILKTMFFKPPGPSGLAQ